VADNKTRAEHPFKRVLRAYGITNDMLAVYLRRNSQYVMVKKKRTENQAIFFRQCSFSYAIGDKYPRVEWSRMLL